MAAAYTHLANMQYHFKLYDEAMANYKKAYDIDKSDFHMLKNYANAL